MYMPSLISPPVVLPCRLFSPFKVLILMPLLSLQLFDPFPLFDEMLSQNAESLSGLSVLLLTEIPPKNIGLVDRLG